MVLPERRLRESRENGPSGQGLPSMRLTQYGSLDMSSNEQAILRRATDQCMVATV